MEKIWTAEERLGDMMSFFGCIGRLGAFRSVQSDVEPNYPRVHSVSVWDFVWRCRNEVGSVEKPAVPREMIPVWENVPWKLNRTMVFVGLGSCIFGVSKK